MSIHVKTAAGWEEIGAGGGVAEGAPPAPLIDAASQAGGSVIKFTSGGDGAAGPTLAYGATITPDATVTVDQDNLEVSVSGTEPFTDYVVEVYGVNIAGRGEVAKTAAFQLNYNEATGGDVVDEYTRLSDNTRWRYHQFITVGSSTFTVTENVMPFSYLIVAGGGGGGAGQSGSSGGGGGAGGVLHGTVQANKEAIPVTVGNSGNGATLANGGLPGHDTYDGGTSSWNGVTASGGGGGGSGVSGGRHNGNAGGSGGGGQGGLPGSGGGGTSPQGNPGARGEGVSNSWRGGGGGGAIGAGSSATQGGGAGYVSDITGTDVPYGGGGGGGAYNTVAGNGGSGGGGNGGSPHGPTQSQGTDGRGGGGGGGTGHGGNGARGGSGVVIVAYEIGTSTTRQIEQAEAEHAARESGYATGYDVGVTDGYDAARDDLQAAVEASKEAEENPATMDDE